MWKRSSLPDGLELWWTPLGGKHQGVPPSALWPE